MVQPPVTVVASRRMIHTFPGKSLNLYDIQLNILESTFSRERLGRGVKLNFWKSNHKNVKILDFENEMIRLNLTPIRNQDTQGQDFLH